MAVYVRLKWQVLSKQIKQIKNVIVQGVHDVERVESSKQHGRAIHNVDLQVTEGNTGQTLVRGIRRSRYASLVGGDRTRVR